MNENHVYDMIIVGGGPGGNTSASVSYTHLRAHETGRNLVCRLLLEKKKKEIKVVKLLKIQCKL